MRILTIIIVILLAVSCTLKQKYINDKTNKNLKASHDSVDYKFKKQEKWLELKKLLANDLMSAEELGIVACSTFKRPPVEIELKQPFKAWRLKQQNESWILNTWYKWNTYELNGKDLCIEMLEPQQEFLSELDSRVLLSASLNYHFEEIKLEHSFNYKVKKFKASSNIENCYLHRNVDENSFGYTSTDNCVSRFVAHTKNIPIEEKVKLGLS